MKAMLLTAGRGERMLPLTLSQPKAAIPVLGRPLVLQILQWLGTNGVEDAVLNLHHLPDAIKALLEETSAGMPAVRYTFEEEILGTAGGIRRASPVLRDGRPVVVSNSDFLSDIELGPVLDAHLTSGCLATMVLAPPRPGYSVVETDAEGRVISLGGDPPVEPRRVAGKYLFTGCHVIEEEVLDRIPDDGPSCIVRDVYRPLAEEGRLGSFVHDGFWWEFGSPELYLDGSLHLLDCSGERRRRISGDHDSVRQLDRATAAVGPGSDFHKGARFEGRTALGYSCYVSDGAHVEDSVVMPEAWIGPGCKVKRSVIGQGAELPAGFETREELVCADLDPTLPPPAETRRENGLLIYSFGSR